MAQKSLNDPWDPNSPDDEEKDTDYAGNINSDLDELTQLLRQIINEKEDKIAENRFGEYLESDDFKYRVFEGADDYEEHSSRSDGAFAMRQKNLEDEHKRNLESLRASHERNIADKHFVHNKNINWALISFILLLFGASVGVLGIIAITAPHNSASKNEAIAALGPLIGLGLGFATGKVKLPSF